ncbi:MAG: ATP-binding cassette domain-containing protein [Chromatiales bacterium]|nr:ATP-binding cassette domain-containing protein [Chromatiales bacterium]
MPDSPADRPKASSLRPLRALWPFVRPYWRRVIAAILAMVVAAGALLALPVALRYVIDFGIGANDPDTIDRYFLWLFAAALVFGFFAALRIYLVNWLGERVVADVRNSVYHRVLRMDPTFFEVTRTGEVLSRLTTDTTLIQSIAGVGVSIALRNLLQLSGSLVMLAITSWRLMGMIILLVPAVVVPLILIGRRVRKLSRTSQDRVADTSGMAGETLNAIQTVQAFTMEEFQGRRYAEAVQGSFRAGLNRIKASAMLTAVSVIALFGAISFVLWLGAHAVLAGEMTGGELGQFLLYAMFVAASAASLSEVWSEVQRGAGAMERLAELNDARPRIRIPETPAPMPEPSRGAISFEDVSFRYPSRPDARALDGFTLDIAPGENIAFVGPSGAGKSTTFQLLLRFYDLEGGRILVDGVDIALANPEALRRRIGVVPQETVIFGATARENIRFGRPDASDAEVEAAARAAAAEAFISQLPEGYDTFLGERGARLSGGQRQRIAIARAMLRNPPILLLDEATSALDAESERLVQEALERLQRDRTTIVIAHRLATVLKADRIVVMDEGRIVDIGTHAELVRRDPLYARLAELQFGEQPEAAARAAMLEAATP